MSTPNKRGGRKPINGVQDQILAALAAGTRSTASMAAEFGVYVKSVAVVLYRLKKNGRVIMDEDASGHSPTLWRLSEAPAACLLAEAWPMPVALPQGQARVHKGEM